jgi:hypothetical protein
MVKIFVSLQHLTDSLSNFYQYVHIHEPAVLSRDLLVLLCAYLYIRSNAEPHSKCMHECLFLLSTLKEDMALAWVRRLNCSWQADTQLIPMIWSAASRYQWIAFPFDGSQQLLGSLPVELSVTISCHCHCPPFFPAPPAGLSSLSLRFPIWALRITLQYEKWWRGFKTPTTLLLLFQLTSGSCSVEGALSCLIERLQQVFRWRVNKPELVMDGTTGGWILWSEPSPLPFLLLSRRSSQNQNEEVHTGRIRSIFPLSCHWLEMVKIFVFLQHLSDYWLYNIYQHVYIQRPDGEAVFSRDLHIYICSN